MVQGQRAGEGEKSTCAFGGLPYSRGRRLRFRFPVLDGWPQVGRGGGKAQGKHSKPTSNKCVSCRCEKRRRRTQVTSREVCQREYAKGKVFEHVSFPIMSLFVVDVRQSQGIQVNGMRTKCDILSSGLSEEFIAWC
ncbi:hypothetical protein TNIN_325831 [Trichonephila inaurata madagascariensis]|uniref:Uncharacterized protein n=1 Tax=Trichonephila inaurata madagascariensis TaxID=2747483 RepID=A0A8X6IH21_9ARAC|nr:hypothetical protein TNIN_325831 [Trichonephila inaurata madagascariensis]